MVDPFWRTKDSRPYPLIARDQRAQDDHTPKTTAGVKPDYIAGIMAADSSPNNPVIFKHQVTMEWRLSKRLAVKSTQYR